LTDKASSKLIAFAGKNTSKFVFNSYVLPEKIPDLSSAYTNIASWNVEVGAYEAVKLGHKILAELHHFLFRTAFVFDIRTAFSAPHRKAGEAVFGCLFESKEFKDTQVYSRLEAQSALVGANRAVHLHPVTPVDLHFTLIVQPWNTEHNYTLW